MLECICARWFFIWKKVQPLTLVQLVFQGLAFASLRLHLQLLVFSFLFLSSLLCRLSPFVFSVFFFRVNFVLLWSLVWSLLCRSWRLLWRLPLPFPFAFAFAFALACAKATPAGLFKFVFLPSCSPVSASSFSGVASCSLSSSGVSASFSAFFAASASFTPCASFAFLAAMASKYLDLGEPGRHRAVVLFGVTSPSLIKSKETA